MGGTKQGNHLTITPPQSYAHRKVQAFKATTKQLKRLLHRSIFKLDLFLDSRQKFSYKSLVTFLDAK